MIRNYLIIVFKSLSKNKFFTSVSLFGIGFTLMLLVLVASLFESNLGKLKPLSNKDHLVVSNRGVLLDLVFDTIVELDTFYENGQMKIDSQIQYSERHRGGWHSQLGYFILDRYYRDVPKVDRYTFFRAGITRDVFVNDQKLSLATNHTDMTYWDIFNFEFIEGRSFNKQELALSTAVVVISEDASRAIFGTSHGVIGNQLSTNGKHYTVVGVVKSVKTFVPYVNSDLFFPLTQLDPVELDATEYLGSFTAVYMTDNSRDREAIIQSLYAITKAIPLPAAKSYDRLIIASAEFDASIASQIMPVEDPKKAWFLLRGLVFLLVAIFVAVPTLNLINLNVSQILERSSELGVRKAFGATRNDIVQQLLFENVVLCILGGVLGFLAALLCIWLINNSGFDLFQLRFNVKVFLQSFVLLLVFGIISGIIPALKTSNIHVVDALKNTKI